MGTFVTGNTALPALKVDASPPQGLATELDAADINNIWTALGDVRTAVFATPNVVNVKDPQYGAKGDGTTNDTAALQAALNTGQMVFLPPGTYSVTGLTAVAGASLVCWGQTATIKLAVGSTTALSISIANFRVSGLRFDGGNVGPYNVNTATPGTRSGIRIAGTVGSGTGAVYNIKIDDCYATGFDLAGLYIGGSGVGTAQAVNGDTGLPAVDVTRFNAITNYNGIFLDQYGEYVQLTNVQGSYSYAGLHLIGGNDRVLNSLFTKNYKNGFLEFASNNPHHGLVMGCSFNHAAAGGRGLDINHVEVGFVFIGCYFWYGDIVIADSGGIVITDSSISNSAITTSYASVYNAGTNMLHHNWLLGSVTRTFSSSIPVVWRDNIVDGTANGFAPTLTYGATITPDAALGDLFFINANNATPFTIATPTNVNPSLRGQRMTIMVKNISAGALGALTWAGVFHLSAWTQPAAAFGRSITFIYDGAGNWFEISRTPADVPN